MKHGDHPGIIKKLLEKTGDVLVCILSIAPHVGYTSF